MANNMNIDKEWENFISSSYNDDISDDEDGQFLNNLNEISNQNSGS